MAAMMPVSQQLRQELTSPEYESAHDAFTTGNGLLVLVLCVLVVSIVFYVFVMSEYEVTDASTFAGLANLLVSKVGVGLSCTLLCVVLLFAWRWSQGGGMGRVMSLSGGAVLLVALVVAGMGVNSSGGATGMRWSTYEFPTDVREAFSAPREHPWLLLSFLILAAVSVASVRGGLRKDRLYPLSMSFVTLLLTAGVVGYTMASVSALALKTARLYAVEMPESPLATAALPSGAREALVYFGLALAVMFIFGLAMALGERVALFYATRVLNDDDGGAAATGGRLPKFARVVRDTLVRTVQTLRWAALVGLVLPFGLAKPNHRAAGERTSRMGTRPRALTMPRLFFGRKTSPAAETEAETEAETQEVEDIGPAEAVVEAAVLVVCDRADKAKAAELADALQPHLAEPPRMTSSPREAGDIASDTQVAHVLIRAKADYPGPQFDVFLSHEWGVHAEAREIAERPGRDHGLRVWLDVNEQSAAATEVIDRAKTFVVLATAQYMTEVNAGDNACKCYKELVCAGDHSVNRTVVAALEPAMLHAAAKISNGNTFRFNVDRAPVVDLTSVGSASVARLARSIEQSEAASRAQNSLPQGMRELFAHLSPVDSTPWAKKADAFSSGPQPRGFLDSVGRWYQSEDRIIVVQGDDNVGKSTALAEMCRRGGAFGGGSPSERHRASMLRKMWRQSGTERPPMPVVAMHCFRREVVDDSAATALKSISWQVGLSVPGFASALELEQIARTEDTLTDIFDAVLAAPAARVSAPQARQAVVLDALDACVDGKDLIQKVIVERWTTELPPWLCLVVSTRPDPQFLRMLADFHTVVLDERVHEQQEVMRVETTKRLSRVKRTGKGVAAPKPKARVHRRRDAEAGSQVPASVNVFIIHARADGGAASLLRDTLQAYAEKDVVIIDRIEEGFLIAFFEADPTAEAVVLVLVSEAMQAEIQRGRNRAFAEASNLLPSALLPVVVDETMLTQKSWTGDLGLVLGNELYVDFHEPADEVWEYLTSTVDNYPDMKPEEFYARAASNPFSNRKYRCKAQ